MQSLHHHSRTAFGVDDRVVVEKSEHSRDLLETILKQCISEEISNFIPGNLLVINHII